MLYIIRNISNYFVSACIIAIILFIFLIVYQSENKKTLTLTKKGLMRYTLLCHGCNWEWMSNVTNKKYVKKCPNCNEISKIEIIGIRRVHKLPKRSNKDLTSYFRK
jgi:hypothetical protein